MRRDFPDYAELSNPKPLSLGETQALLTKDQALVLFLDLWQMGNRPEETIVFAVTKTQARWVSVPVGNRALAGLVAILRCGLDATNWRAGEESREVCKKLLNTEVSQRATPPFDAATALELYHDLFSGIEDLIKGKSLLIVPSGALTQLPFEVLLTDFPGQDDYGLKTVKVGLLGATLDQNLTAADRGMPKVPAEGAVKMTALNANGPAERAGLKPGDILLSIDGEACANTQSCIQLIQSHAPGTTIGVLVVREGDERLIPAMLEARERKNWVPRFLKAGEGKEFGWLGVRQAITVLPSAGSLKALRTAKTSPAKKPFVGFGNPLLTGPDGGDTSAWGKQRCANAAPPARALIASRMGQISSLFRDGDISIENLRRQPPLPETADELCAVGSGLGVPPRRLDNVVYLGNRATVSQIKAPQGGGFRACARCSFRHTWAACFPNRVFRPKQKRARLGTNATSG